MPPRPDFAPWLDDTNDVLKTFISAAGIPDLINLAGGLPDPSVFPVEALSEIAVRAVRDHPEDTLTYTPADGLPGFRDLIAQRHSTDKVRLNRDNVIVTTGGTQALSLLGRVLLTEGQKVAAQSPAYLGALDAWRPRRPSYRPIALDGNARDFEAWLSGAQFGYAVPNFSNPSGHLVDLNTRRALVEASEATGTWMIEDDPYGHLYFDGDPLPTLLELSATGTGPYDGPVIYLGTMAKTLAPGLRVGWIIAAPEVIEAVAKAKVGADMFTAGLNQRIAWGAMEAGLLEDGLPHMIELYRDRRDALCAALEAEVADLYDWEKPVGGMFVWTTAKDPGMDTDALMKVGLDHKVCLSPSSVFDPEGRDKRSLRLNFTLNPEDRLTEGVRRLSRATRELAA